MKNKFGLGTLATGIIGGIVIVFTVALFLLLNFERATVHWAAFGFLLLSEIILFGGLIGVRFAGDSFGKLFIRAGLSSTLFLYFVFTLISFVIAGLFEENLNLFIMLQITIVSLFVIIAIATLAIARRVAITNEKDAEKVNVTEPKRGKF